MYISNFPVGKRSIPHLTVRNIKFSFSIINIRMHISKNTTIFSIIIRYMYIKI